MSIVEACLFAFPVVVGVALLLLSRWARKRNADLSARNGKFLHDDFPKELRGGPFLMASRALFFGDMGQHDALIGRVLAAVVIIAVTVALVDIAIALALR